MRTTLTLTETTGVDSEGYLIAVIPIGSTTRFYTVETPRLADEYDVNAPGDAVLIHTVDTTAMARGDLNTPAATVMDPDGNGNPNDSGAMWTSGETFHDALNDITISVTAATATSATVVITTYRLFTDDPLVPNVSMVRALHIAELRSRVDALRVRFGLAPFVWTDSTLAGGATAIRAVHITDLRLALSQAYSAAGLTLPTYTDPDLSVGMTIKAAHISELRTAVIAIE